MLRLQTLFAFTNNGNPSVISLNGQWLWGHLGNNCIYRANGTGGFRGAQAPHDLWKKETKSTNNFANYNGPQVYCTPWFYHPAQGLLKIWTDHSYWFSPTLKPLEISQQKFQHFFNLERYEFSQNLEDVAQKLGLPRPSEVLDIFGRKSKFWAPETLIFCTKRVL